MSERESSFRTAAIAYFPMFIATLSLVTSIYNGYLNNKFVDLIQRNLSRAEYLRTCKEILEAHAQVQFRAKLVSQIGERGTAASPAELVAAQNEATNALIRFTSLATYLANLLTDARERYTRLALAMEKIVNEASRLSPSEVEKRFAEIDPMFVSMNEDCVKSAR